MEYRIEREDDEDGTIRYHIWAGLTWLCSIDEDNSKETPVDAKKHASKIVQAVNCHEDNQKLILELCAALMVAAKTFRWYEQLHAAKPDLEKAKRNAEFAEQCESALAKAGVK